MIEVTGVTVGIVGLLGAGVAFDTRAAQPDPVTGVCGPGA